MEAKLKELHEELKSTHEEFKSRVEEMNQQIKEHGVALPETKEAIERLQKKMDEIEEQQKGLLDAVKKLSKPPVPDGDEEGKTSSAEQKTAFQKFLRYGPDGLSLEEKSLLVVDREEKGAKSGMTASNAVTGGFLAYPELETEMLKELVEKSPVREVARVRKTSNRSVWVPKRTGLISASWANETETASESQFTVDGVEITPQKLSAKVLVSTEDLEDMEFDIEEEIRTEFSDQFGVAESTGFINGDTVKKPEGMLFNNDVSEVKSGDANNLTYTGLVNLVHDLPSPYARNASFLLKRVTVGAIRLLTDGNGRLIWQPGFALGNPPTILGYPYREAPDMPAVAAGAYPILFGDFYKAYRIVDRRRCHAQRTPQAQDRCITGVD